MKWLLYSVIFVAFVQNGVGRTKPFLTIGALFHEDEDDLAVAFTYALQQRNMFFSDIVFKAEMDYIDKSDTFGTQKILCNWTQFGEGIAAIIGPSSPKTAPMAQSIAQTLEIPHIQVHWTPTKKMYYTAPGTEMTINFYPDQDLLAHAIAVVVKNLHWKNYVIIYEDSDSLIRLQDVLQLAHQDHDPVVVRQLGPGPDYRAVLKEFKDEMIHRIILDCKIHVCFEVLKQAKEIGFLEYVYNYFLSNLDAHTMNISSLGAKANITTIRLVDPARKPVKQAIHNWEMEIHQNNRSMNVTPETMRTELALMDDAVAHLTDTISQLHTTEPIKTRRLSCDNTERWEGGIRIASFMKVHPHIDGTTGTSSFDQRGRRNEFNLELIEFDRGIPEKIAEWESHNKDAVISTRSESKKMQKILGNLQNELVIISSKLGPPYLVRREREYTGQNLTGNARFDGYSLDVIDAIATYLKFDYEFRLNKDDANGEYDKTKKTWNGIMRDLIDVKAHMAICDITITEERRSYVDFSVPYMSLGISILYRKGKENEMGLLAFLDPLETEVWLYILTSFVIVTLTMNFLTRMAPGDWENPQPLNKNPKELENVWTFKNCLWLMLGSTMSCGCYIMPKGISSRMGISMWWFLILIITNSYKANLAAFLTTTRMGTEIDSAEALSKQTKIKYGTVNGGSTQAFFRDAKHNKIYRKMWQDMIQAKPSAFEKKNEDGVKRVLNAKNQGYAFLMESSQIEYEIARDCNLKQVGGRLDNKGYGIAMPVNSPYRSAINEAILRLQENGTLRKLKAKWWKKQLGAKTCEAEPVQQKAFSFANVRGTFLVTIVGIAIAFVFTVIDFLWHAREISIQEHIPYLDALRIEFSFAVRIFITKKRVKHKNQSIYACKSMKSIENIDRQQSDSSSDVRSSN